MERVWVGWMVYIGKGGEHFEQRNNLSKESGIIKLYWGENGAIL